jgi:hypothetical protein
MVPLPRDEYIGQVDYWQSFVILSSIHLSSPNYHLTPMEESDNPLLPLQRPPFGNLATHKAHPLMFQAEFLSATLRMKILTTSLSYFPGSIIPRAESILRLRHSHVLSSRITASATEDRDGKMRVKYH